MKRQNRVGKEVVTTHEVAAALGHVQKMIAVIHGECHLLCWTYRTQKTPDGAVRIWIWGEVEMYHTGERSRILCSPKFHAELLMTRPGDFSDLVDDHHVRHILDVASRDYNVSWYSEKQVYQIYPLVGNVTYVGSGASDRQTVPTTKDLKGLDYSI